MALYTFMPRDILDYYTYTDSIKSPPCSKDVIWIDLIKTVDITKEIVSIYDGNISKINIDFRIIFIFYF